MAVVARHRPPQADSGEAGDRVTVPRDCSETYLNGTSQEPIPEDARLPARLRPIGDYSPEGRAYSSERRTAIWTVAASNAPYIRAIGTSQKLLRFIICHVHGPELCIYFGPAILKQAIHFE